MALDTVYLLFSNMLAITCAVKKIDDRLLNQIRVNGSCVVPIGKTKNQQRQLKTFDKTFFDPLNADFRF